ncbi:MULTISPECIES: LytTR family DNA-binding domain-containing protein [unclassified Aureispira]|uniref:LytR/AlgR family response regulator transcription factor n=1 Tax=unclassified Aureispira TaxID=2649989 RepID=UPI000697216E|nr:MULTISPECIES: LytTR family DNA-binding domain-containing protein [unclassified Aureispira]WMX12646.1 LytTR family DNA-binding domain-containing protein [Aureispira sp. CCB-E]
MNALIVDDEKQARETLLQIIRLCCTNITICREANSVLDAIIEIEKERPDILFLDINLGSNNGFEILQYFEKEPLNVVFVTGHNDYLLKALRASAVDFLLKPVKGSELMAAVQKVEQKRSEQQRYQYIDTLLSNLQDEKESIQKLTISTADSLYILNVDDIIYCESDKGYTTFYTTDKQKIIVSKIIREYEEILPKKNFMRVHQSFLVNLNHVQRYDKKDKNALITTLNYQVPVSHRLKAKVLGYFDNIGN